MIMSKHHLKNTKCWNIIKWKFWLLSYIIASTNSDWYGILTPYHPICWQKTIFNRICHIFCPQFMTVPVKRVIAEGVWEMALELGSHTFFWRLLIELTELILIVHSQKKNWNKESIRLPARILWSQQSVTNRLELTQYSCVISIRLEHVYSEDSTVYLLDSDYEVSIQ